MSSYASPDALRQSASNPWYAKGYALGALKNALEMPEGTDLTEFIETAVAVLEAMAEPSPYDHTRTSADAL